MPLVLVQSAHLRVICDGCRQASAELCARREIAATARSWAVPKFRAAGWHHDPGSRDRARANEHAEREGTGKWYCPACTRNTHM